jgi:hypothetical protein
MHKKVLKFDGFVKSPSAALRFPPEAGKHPRPVEFSLRETVKPIQQGKSSRRTSMYASFLSEFILSLSKDALPQAGFRFAQLASGSLYCAVLFDDFLRIRQDYLLTEATTKSRSCFLLFLPS